MEYRRSGSNRRRRVLIDESAVHSKLAGHGLMEQHKLEKTVVAHCGVTWKNRTWPKEYWRKALTELARLGWHVLMVGKGPDFEFTGERLYNFKNQFSVQQLSYLIDSVGCFVSNDSGLLHVAGTTNTRIVGIFTSAKGEYRVPWRKGEYGHSCTVLRPKVKCYGCLHTHKPPVFYVDCDINTFQCLGEITPEMVVEAVNGPRN